MRGFYYDLCGLGERRNGGAHGYYAEGLGLVRREAAHPLVKHRGDDHIVIAEPVQVLLGKLLEGTDCRHVLNQVPALTVAHGDVLYALLRRKQSLDYGDGMAYAGRNESSGKGAVGLAVYGNAHFLIQSGEAVDVLPIGYGAFYGNVFAVGQIVADAAALVACKAAGKAYFGEQAGVRSAVANLYRHIQGFYYTAAAGNTVIYRGKAVEHGTV